MYTSFQKVHLPDPLDPFTYNSTYKPERTPGVDGRGARAVEYRCVHVGATDSSTAELCCTRSARGAAGRGDGRCRRLDYQVPWDVSLQTS